MFSKIEKSSVVAVALAITLAFGFSAFTPAKLTEDLWGRDANGVYTNITQSGMQEGIDYTCVQSEDPCKVSYPIGQDPNLNPSGGTQVGADGDFQLLP